MQPVGEPLFVPFFPNPSPVEPYNSSCSAHLNHACCQLNRAHFTIGTVSLAYSKVVISLVSLITTAFLIFKLRPHQNKQNVLLPLYYNVLAITSILYIITNFLTATDIEYSRNSPDKVLLFVIFTLITALQKFIVFIVPIFMSQQDTEGRSLITTVVVSAVIGLVYSITLVVSLAVWNSWLGYVIVMGLSVVYFAATFASLQLPCATSCAPRPAVMYWCVYQLLVNIVAIIGYMFFIMRDEDDDIVGECVTSANAMVASVVFPIIVWVVARKDSFFWRRQQAVQMVIDISEQSTVDPEKALTRLLESGVTVVKWEDLTIKRLIGRGSFSDVFEADWRSTTVAVKKLRTEKDAVPADLLSSLIQESALIAKLRHPNIVLFMGLTYAPPEMAMVTEYLDMGSLWQIIHPAPGRPRIRVSWPRKVKILKDVARGMAFLHSCSPPLLHRDLKSDNVLLSTDWSCKVADFGLSRSKNASSMSSVGTPQWMAPEVLREEKYGEAADVYSFGVIIWEIVTEQRPWGDATPMKVMWDVAHRNETLPVPENAPDVLREMIRACFQPAPLRPSFKEILRTLDNVSDEDLPPESDGPHSSASPRARSSLQIVPPNQNDPPLLGNSLGTELSFVDAYDRAMNSKV